MFKKNKQPNDKNIWLFVFRGATRNRTVDTRIFSNKSANSEVAIYQLDTNTLSFMANAVGKTKFAFKLILNLFVIICFVLTEC